MEIIMMSAENTKVFGAGVFMLIVILFLIITFKRADKEEKELLEKIASSGYLSQKAISENELETQQTREEAHQKMYQLMREKTDPLIKELEDDKISIERIREIYDMDIPEDEENRVKMHCVAVLDKILLSKVRALTVFSYPLNGVTKEELIEELLKMRDQAPEPSRAKIEIDLWLKEFKALPN
jgi:hypothetical protein